MLSDRFHRYVRYAEVFVIMVLAGAAFMTHRELEKVRRAPVFLPNYEFERIDDDQGPGVRTRGTWVAEKGPPEPLHTTTIECRKQRMECVESSAAVVFVSGRGLLESAQTIFAVDHWTDRQIVTRPTKGRCNGRTLVLDLQQKKATLRVSASEAGARCEQAPEKQLELVTGFRVRAEALQKAPPS